MLNTNTNNTNTASSTPRQSRDGDTPTFFSNHHSQSTGRRKFWLDFKYLFLEQFDTIKAVWYWFVIITILLPTGLIFGFGHVGSTLTNRSALLYIISGSAIVSVATEAIVNMAQRIATFKSQGKLIYYASLPISKTAFIGALIMSRLVLTLFGMLVPILIAPLIYPISFSFSLWIIGIMLLSAFSLSVIGVALGALVGNPDITGQLGNLLLILLVLASPLFIPVNNLILPLQIIGYLLPPTYAADALRLALSDTFTGWFYFDLVMLGLFMLTGFYMINKYVRWQL